MKAQGINDMAVGTVIGINPQQTSAAGTVPVLIRLTKGGLAFGPGVYGTAAITIGWQRGLVVPSAAIVSDPASGTRQVFRQEGDTYEPVPVAIVQQIGARTAVQRSQLRARDTIVAQGAYELLAPSQSAPMEANGK